MFYLAGREEMQNIDRLTIEEDGIPGILLMERAAISILEEINSRLKQGSDGDGRNVSGEKNRPLACLVVVEGGNNGGDGLALARLLHQQGEQVQVCYINGLKRVSESFETQLEIVKKLGIDILDTIPHEAYDVVVDGIFGVGLKREIGGVWKDTIDIMNSMTGFKIAIDLPSGVDASTGQILETAFRADLTVTFGLYKRGLMLYPGCDMAGTVVVRDIGFSKEAIDKVAPVAYAYDTSDMTRLPARVNSSNKGTYGRVAVIAGSRDMSGAASYAAEAVYRVGAGLVKVYTHTYNRNVIGCTVPEAVLMFYDDEESAVCCAEDALNWADVILIGPGLGRSPEACAMVKIIVNRAEQPVVVDADALNIISCDLDILRDHRGPVIITPHMGEMARLTGMAITDIKKNILKVCKDFAMEYNIIDVLKDARTTVSSGDKVYINTSGNNGMSTAGAGDILAGIIAGLIATGLMPEDAAPLGVYIHGLAGDAAAGYRGKTGMIARDIVDAIPQVIRD